MRSRLQVAKPAAAAAATAPRTATGSWLPPEPGEHVGTIDWTPNDSRLTPAAA